MHDDARWTRIQIWKPVREVFQAADELFEEAERLRRAGPERAAQFSWERSARRHLAAYERLMSGAAGDGVEQVAASRG